ncbi:ChbG/HpnK family deacetylase [Methylobacterium nonmethylotrophicum]|uniref:ChbG/HpnK family deacetylase n=1 Tax=Methylobacterium nonmethylotrophicum TaxID=1141884 RepID=A0A4Z0NES3_9HYPH|nr:ChbG/HpnK family deacetylase [Methylobacterium nonmethylotrophicum]TGD92740.1 ChbG/HpnK family deacetylase [Methylobacterium nonmethylotrophicum]
MLPERRPVVLCADDYGLSPGVSRGILALARGRRISATGAMTNIPAFREAAAALGELRGTTGLGLHLTLTAGAPLGPLPRLAPDGRLPPLGRLLGLSLSGRLAASDVRPEIERQLDAFASAIGHLPDFVDGHQHVHVLPGVRAALLGALKARGWQGWLRDPGDAPGAILARPHARKAIVVAGLGLGFRGAARRAGFSTNRGFSGFSDFAAGDGFAEAFARSFRALGPAPVVMCHPGEIDQGLRDLDPVVESRPLELAYLGSVRFGEFLEREGLRLVPGPVRVSDLA